MKCPFCEKKMSEGSLKCYKCAPMWKGADGRKFTFGKAKFLMNTTKGVWYCQECDCLIVKNVGEKIEH